MLRQALPTLAGFAFALTLSTAQAEPSVAPGTVACGEHAALVEALTTRYDEEPVTLGLQNNGQLLEIYASAQSGSWTILSTRVDGTSCVLAVGKHFEQRSLETNGPNARHAPAPGPNAAS